MKTLLTLLVLLSLLLVIPNVKAQNQHENDINLGEGFGFQDSATNPPTQNSVPSQNNLTLEPCVKPTSNVHDQNELIIKGRAFAAYSWYQESYDAFEMALKNDPQNIEAKEGKAFASCQLNLLEKDLNQFD